LPHRKSANVDKGIVYYTDNRLDPRIMAACQKQLQRANLPIISVSLEPIDFGNTNIVLYEERGIPTMFKQILAGISLCNVDVIFLCEHDVLYDPSHFEFTPTRGDTFYYNQNSWKVDSKTGKALFHYASSVSGLCAYRDLLLRHYRKRVEMVNRCGFTQRMGFEPGTHRRKERVDDYGSEVWMSERPNLDIKHGQNLTPTRWERDQFRNQKYTAGWMIADHVPGWYTAGNFDGLLDMDSAT
jgi:hypothetical protein